MKIKKFRIKKFNLTKLYLLKYKIYKNVSDLSVLNFFKYIQFTLKQSLILISKYHLRNKRILFLGFSYSRKKQSILKNLNHIFLPKSLWLNGSTIKTNLILQNTFYQKKPDLIVFLERQHTDSVILKELNNLSIPIIIFGDSIFSKNNQFYSILGNIEKIELKKFFHFLIYSIIKI